MRDASSVRVKEIIDRLEAKYGSLRKAGKRFGVSHQTLSNWRTGNSKELERVFQFLKDAQKDLKLSDSATYRRAVRK
jgi:hypothetical protein